MIIDIYLHSDKESMYDAAKEAGLTGDALSNACYLGYEVKLTYDVDSKGNGKIIAVDDRKVSKS